MRICLASPAFPLDEGDYRAAFCLDFARALEARGHRVVIHTPNRTGTRADLGLDVRWFSWSGGAKPIARTRFWHPVDLRDLVSVTRNGSNTLLRLVREEKVDTCLALWALPAGVFARHVFRRTGVPYSVWALGSDIWTYGRLPVFSGMVRNVFRDASRCFADGFELAAQVRSLYGRECFFLPSSRRLPPATTGLTGGMRPAASPPGGSPAAARFLYVGRFDHVKGVDLIPEAVDLLRREGREFTIRVFGEGPLERSLRRRVAALGLDAVMSLGGRISRQDFSDELAGADALVVPSRMESVPVVMTDALQKGVPVLASEVGDMGDLIRRHGAGRTFAPGDPAAMARCLAGFMDGMGRDRYETEALARAFSIDTAAGTFLDTIQGNIRPA